MPPQRPLPALGRTISSFFPGDEWRPRKLSKFGRTICSVYRRGDGARFAKSLLGSVSRRPISAPGRLSTSSYKIFFAPHFAVGTEKTLRKSTTNDCIAGVRRLLCHCRRRNECQHDSYCCKSHSTLLQVSGLPVPLFRKQGLMEAVARVPSET